MAVSRIGGSAIIPRPDTRLNVTRLIGSRQLDFAPLRCMRVHTVFRDYRDRFVSKVRRNDKKSRWYNEAEIFGKNYKKIIFIKSSILEIRKKKTI